MHTNLLIRTVATAAILAFAGVASAQTTAVATTDLNIRSGPGPQYEIIGAIKGDDEATVNGCLEGSKWCLVTYDGTDGWVYSEYLITELSGQRVVVVERRQDVNVPVVTFEEPTGGTAGGAATGAVAGALIGGPIGAAVGAVAGAAAGTAIDPPSEVRTYVTTNQVDPIYLEGDVVVGAGLPETVELREVPEYEYRYAYVNGQPVLVDPGSRRIVYVVRN
jgi:uncharacterized protein YraI